MLFSLLIDFGHLTLVLSLISSFFQVVIPIFNVQKNNIFLLNTVKPITKLSFLLTLISFIILMIGFVVSDFSIDLVAKHSHTLKPLIYKIAGTWANHEGSLLLWILILQFFGFLLTYTNIPILFISKVLSIQGAISSAFLGLCIFSSNPFLRSNPFPSEGAGLNPILQDLALSFHPPILYIGYVGLSVSFSFSIAALIDGKIDNIWAKWVRPWIMIAWVMLTLGIGLGSFWAYYELGWGGWWFWDPVENVAIMPWLLTTALIHSVLVLENRSQLKAWTILLSILSFSFSILGTFIVRSGIITSVHSFATDPERGLIILSILAVVTISPLTLYIFRKNLFNTQTNFKLISKESTLIINNFFLVISTLIILTGTLYPLGLEYFTNKQITVGPPYFISTLTPIMLAIMFFMGIGPLTNWRYNRLYNLISKLLPSIIFIVISYFILLIFYNLPIIAVLGFLFSGWIIISLLILISKQILIGKNSFNFKVLSLKQFAVFFAHIGIAVFSIGAISDSFFSKEITLRSYPGQNISIGNNKLKFDSSLQRIGPNFISQTSKLILYDSTGKTKAILYPEKRIYPIEQQTTSEVAIHRQLDRDLYIVFGDGDKITGFTFRIYLKPFISMIWIGCILMALGGMFAIYPQIKKRIQNWAQN